METYLYVITNTINNRLYVGVSKNPKQRWKSHVQLSQKKSGAWSTFLSNAMKKHGHENFTMNVLRSYENQEKAYRVEKKLTVFLKHRGVKLYNIIIGGAGHRHTTIDGRTRIGLAAKQRQTGIPLPEKTKQKIANALQGKTVKQEPPLSIKINLIKNCELHFKRDGEHNSNSKLTEENVREIKQTFLVSEIPKNEFCWNFASKFNVIPGLIHRIINGTLWQHVQVCDEKTWKNALLRYKKIDKKTLSIASKRTWQNRSQEEREQVRIERSNNNPNASLSIDNVLCIRSEWAKIENKVKFGVKAKFCHEFAEKFNVSGATIDGIVKHKTWKHI